jgi:hypothetical protein
MNCYNHPSEPAIGLCKSCCKALCRHCLIEQEHGLACRDTPCEERVPLINKIIDSNKKVLAAANVQNRIATASTFGMGAVFCVFGVIFWTAVNDFLGIFMLMMGVIIVISGFRRMRASARYPQIDSEERGSDETSRLHDFRQR